MVGTLLAFSLSAVFQVMRDGLSRWDTTVQFCEESACSQRNQLNFPLGSAPTTAAMKRSC